MKYYYQEVVNVEYDAIWQAFAQTGDPVYYLLYKGLGANDKADKIENGSGNEPRPTD